MNNQITRTAGIILFYLQERKRTTPCTYDEWINDQEFWDEFFRFSFRTIPTDPIPVEKNYHPGSTDPKWDMLLHNFKAMRAVKLVLRWQKYKAAAAAPKLKEKAA